MEIIYFKNAQDFRKWLEQNYQSCSGIWMKFFKKHTAKENIAYEKAVEEAICFGWIDSLIKKIDEDSYIRKFTPRSNDKNWSRVNQLRVSKLLKENRMKKAGLEKIDSEMLCRIQNNDIPAKKEISLPDFIKRQFMIHEPAWTNFQKLAASYQRQYLHWILQAKKERTQEKRLEESIQLLQANKKLGMK